ncbi:MAG: hypothetical protein QOE90_631 [Thermoplasmata archaeon]|nr:hypothetical protein [Thermoplasmata archaeon]
MARKTGSIPGDVVRYVPASEPMVAALSIALLTLVEVVFAVLFIFLLVTSGPTFHAVKWPLPGGQNLAFEGNSVEVQQAEAFALGGALLTLAAILSIYRKFFLPDVMIVKRRKLKYEDLM